MMLTSLVGSDLLTRFSAATSSPPSARPRDPTRQAPRGGASLAPPQWHSPRCLYEGIVTSYDLSQSPAAELFVSLDSATALAESTTIVKLH